MCRFDSISVGQQHKVNDTTFRTLDELNCEFQQRKLDVCTEHQSKFGSRHKFQHEQRATMQQQAVGAFRTLDQLNQDFDQRRRQLASRQHCQQPTFIAGGAPNARANASSFRSLQQLIQDYQVSQAERKLHGPCIYSRDQLISASRSGIAAHRESFSTGLRMCMLQSTSGAITEPGTNSAMRKMWMSDHDVQIGQEVHPESVAELVVCASSKMAESELTPEDPCVAFEDKITLGSLATSIFYMPKSMEEEESEQCSSTALPTGAVTPVSGSSVVDCNHIGPQFFDLTAGDATECFELAAVDGDGPECFDLAAEDGDDE